MKKKYSKEGNYIKVNLSSKNNSQSNNSNIKGNAYIKMKQKKDSYLRRNKNIRLVKKNLKVSKIIKEEKQNTKKEDIFTRNISLSPFMPKDNCNYKKKEELKYLERNTISMRRLDYSMKVKK